MQVTKTVLGDRMELALEGKVDTRSALDFEEEVRDQLDSIREMVIDLSKVVYISSAGLRVLLSFQQQMVEKDGCVILRNVPPDVREIFEVTGFDRIFQLPEPTE